MTISSFAQGRRRLRSTDDLIEALQIPFSDEQLEAICAPLEPGVIIAGAGSGKTAVMAARVVWLVGTGQVRPDAVLGLTFTRKAAAELAHRVRDSLERAGVTARDADDGQEVVMTYDSFAARLVAEHGLRMGLETTPTVITGATRYRLAARAVNAAEGPFTAISRLRPASVVERVLKLDSDMQSHLVDAHRVRMHAAGFAPQLDAAPLNNRRNVYADIKRAKGVLAERLELVDLAGDYARIKAELGVSEFADQLAWAAALVDSVPSVSALVRRQFSVVLLDEYQDTSSAQAQLLRGLFGGGHPVTAVGDPLQAIYGWRGAAASNITSFATEFRRADGEPARQYQLSVNRRSEQQILDVANDIGGALRSGQDAAGVAVAELRAPAGRNGGVVVALGFETAADEVAWIAESIADQGRDADVDWSETAVLVRRNADIPALFAALTDRDVPVEIVGLGGLLRLPEVAAVTATLALLNDVGSNPDVVALLSGPRWRIGPDDLRVLGLRAREIARGSSGLPAGGDLVSDLAWALGDADPTETASLFDAVLDPGPAPLSAEARRRLAAFAGEITALLRHVDEPVVELVRRVVVALGLESELAANRAGSADPVRQLAAFTEAVATYVDVDGDASLAGLLAWLRAELDHGVGLDQAVPSEHNSVKLLTVHRAKGLEWSRVHLPGLADKVFPSDRVSDNYLTQPASIPAPLRGDALSIPQLTEVTNTGLAAYAEALKTDQLRAEDRLAYVAVTRAKQVLIGSWHVWSPGLQRPRAASDYFAAIEREASRQGNVLAVAPPPARTNPLDAAGGESEWPPPLDPALHHERAQAADWVRGARAELASGMTVADGPMSHEASALVAHWDTSLDVLIAQALEHDGREIAVEVPESLSVTSLAALRRDPQQWAGNQIRPMPRPPSRAADLGSQFHAWVQRRAGLSTLFDDEPAPAESSAALQRLQQAFERGPYADRVPVAVEAPFVVRHEGHIVRGRIDAVYAATGEHDYQVVDWKTSSQPADPTQLEIYRLAWAQAHGLPVERVDAVFYHVLSGEVVRPSSG